MSPWIVVFYIVTSTGQWAHGDCINIMKAPDAAVLQINSWQDWTGGKADVYVANLNRYYWYGDTRPIQGQTTYTWLPCDPNLPLHELTLDAQ